MLPSRRSWPVCECVDSIYSMLLRKMKQRRERVVSGGVDCQEREGTEADLNETAHMALSAYLPISRINHSRCCKIPTEQDGLRYRTAIAHQTERIASTMASHDSEPDPSANALNSLSKFTLFETKR